MINSFLVYKHNLRVFWNSIQVFFFFIGDVFGALVRRISSQISHIRNVLLTVFGFGAPPSASQKAGLIRDAFGLHKMIVVVTESGKVNRILLQQKIYALLNNFFFFISVIDIWH